MRWMGTDPATFLLRFFQQIGHLVSPSINRLRIIRIIRQRFGDRLRNRKQPIRGIRPRRIPGHSFKPRLQQLGIGKVFKTIAEVLKPQCGQRASSPSDACPAPFAIVHPPRSCGVWSLTFENSHGPPRHLRRKAHTLLCLPRTATLAQGADRAKPCRRASRFAQSS